VGVLRDLLGCLGCGAVLLLVAAVLAVADATLERATWRTVVAVVLVVVVLFETWGAVLNVAKERRRGWRLSSEHMYTFLQILESGRWVRWRFEVEGSPLEGRRARLVLPEHLKPQGEEIRARLEAALGDIPVELEQA